MKLYLLTTLGLFFALTEAAPVLKFQGNTSIYCPNSIGDSYVDNVDAAVNAKAITDVIIPRNSTLYMTPLARRQLRANGEDGRELSWCTNQGCFPGNAKQYCWIIGCTRRRELQASAGAALVKCPGLINKAYASLASESAKQLASSGPYGANCSALILSITVACQE
jgi:hypothetical protein